MTKEFDFSDLDDKPTLEPRISILPKCGWKIKSKKKAVSATMYIVYVNKVIRNMISVV